MSKEIRAIFQLLRKPGVNAGRITVMTLMIMAVISSTTLYAYFQLFVPDAYAANVATQLTVLNTPPNWTVDAEEATESSTSTPTNAYTTLSFTGTATDSSSDNYWLLVCSASSTPVANNNAPPTCGSGVMWARSATTTSGAQATASTSTIETAPFANESNNWYAYICDGNSTGAQCNAVMKNGSGSTVSPFVINHPPVFSSISNNSPQNPNGTLTWTTTAYDNDTIRGGDTVRLVVCKANDFNNATGYCGVGGTWATSTLAASNPATSTPLTAPFQDGTYAAYVHVYDQNLSMATSTNQAFNSSFVVNNVAPSVSSSTVTLVDYDNAGNLTLTVPNATSGVFKVKFTVVDNNGCQNITSGNEISLATTSIYRSGVGQSACQVSGDYNTNQCYPSSNSQALITCTQATSSPDNTCTGASDSDVDWICSFPLWYNADPTDTSTQYTAQNWLASVQVQDDDGLMSPITEAETGNDLSSFLAFNVTQTAINFGGLQPGQQNDPLATTTDLIAVGNVGLDEDLYGDTMCTNWTGFDSCDAGGINATNEIPISNQRAATSSVSFASPYAYTMTASTTPLSVAINVPKTTSTSSPQTKNTWWGINVPNAITVAGAYTGRNVITAIKSSPSFW